MNSNSFSASRYSIPSLNSAFSRLSIEPMSDDTTDLPSLNLEETPVKSRSLLDYQETLATRNSNFEAEFGLDFNETRLQILRELNGDDSITFSAPATPTDFDFDNPPLTPDSNPW